MPLKKQHLALRKVLDHILEGCIDVLFPGICICCDMESVEPDGHICTFCLNEKFEDANPGNNISSSGILLPEGVAVQHALWRFDKGGTLQELLHRLKYEHLVNIGRQTGRELARRIKSHSILRSLAGQGNAILVPVPLHYFRFIRRGYNQAYFIAEGLSEELHIPVCGLWDVVRSRNTRSQTGFNLGARLNNVNGAFEVRRNDVFKGRVALIVDDVFTTGATTFELAKVLTDTGASSVAILTVAQA